MSDNEWTPERIAELREELPAEDDGWSADIAPSVVLSLLDALESARAERDALVRAIERVLQPYHAREVPR